MSSHPHLRHRLVGLLLGLALTAAAPACAKATTSSADATGTSTAGGGATSAPPGAGNPGGKTVDGVKCETSEQLAYHIHSHLAIFVKGTPMTVPAGIGINDNTCIYWLHTHDVDGILHVESPDSRTFTLGNFFAVWGQPLSSTRVAAAEGPVTAYVNGKKFTGDPSTIKLQVQTVIQLDVGSPAPPPRPYTFADGL